MYLVHILDLTQACIDETGLSTLDAISACVDTNRISGIRDRLSTEDITKAHLETRGRKPIIINNELGSNIVWELSDTCPIALQDILIGICRSVPKTSPNQKRLTLSPVKLLHVCRLSVISAKIISELLDISERMARYYLEVVPVTILHCTRFYESTN